jgi:diacylglycerol kinase (ATP)
MTESNNANIGVIPLFDASSSLIGEQALQSSSEESKDLDKKYRRLAWKVAPDLLTSFKYAWAGVSYAFVTQRNFRIHITIAVLATSLGVFLNISMTKMSIIILTSAIVMVLELLNTAIESVVDLTVKQTYHELAKIAKDCAAGAVLISAIAAVLVASFILLPPLLALIL